MGNVIEFKKNDEQITEVVEVATSQLTEHSKQAEYSPPMSKKKWSEFVANIAKAGLHHPIIATKGFKVVGNIYHFRAAKELGIKDVKVIFEDVTDDGVPSYMTNNILQVPELKSGQRAALVVRLFYEEMSQEAKVGQGNRNDLLPDLAKSKLSRDTAEELAKKAGIGRSSMTYLIAVYRNRPDLFERVFNGEYSINRAYTQMKADEQPEGVKCANCSPAVVPSLPADTRRWSCGMRSWSFRTRFVPVRDFSPINSPISESPFWSFAPAISPPRLTPQYSRKKFAILDFLIGSVSACPRLSTFSAISKYSASSSSTIGGKVES
ncbi:hypothetical protein JOC94_000007 [Bacillus thermophilus]|uniref:ParB-like N-terminal domain-containing protein n=1 Tax=Siminovitchia thermophila TaxID=1245522 RepID=A0ABS2R326_9BACI|nr:ParB N-terminal domain-containing protein [Siminovitchia thermophila]MBM7713041.1 hypothetical protein [Siminovitchia thermophila]